ncbi:hypothetical protein ASPZODRAFT_153453 [Penicilliopsis zonata CBS 506.65]|uniref:Serine/threonine-protein kinase ATG1 n=1 Tax=Penicilliopsis zonata CBS 506.65 TaxID=1073090 RepID=A0A1L9SBJ0_9EURO|nr:hypothetical protein ASPZODRAFT_153453 [Penicilliopsis zonata CBS 506.65]OJJ44516.1 hypothetical protein ASPZODRAFT_153453 [Penicilliopsis zonata CBS 506.65]
MSIGRYTRLDEIGRGSFATVYQGVHTKSRTYVAIKSVNLSKLNKKLKDNLSSEIDILKGLHHPHIVALIDCHESVSHIHLVMEYCALGDLSLFIKRRDSLADHRYTRDMIARYPNPRGGALNEVVVRHFLKQLASALKFLRDRNLIHRDIKPQNLLLCPSPTSYRAGVPQTVVPFKGSDDSFEPITGLPSLPMLKIADFGFARSLPATSLAETLCGSPLYMAPEILRYEKYDAKADLWSVGTVLYEMVVGKPPFRATNHVELLRKIEKGEDRIKFPEENPASADVKELICALLKRNPVERMSFPDFFAHGVITSDIPGLVPDDRPRRPSSTDVPTTTTTIVPGNADPSSLESDRREEASVAPVPAATTTNPTSRPHPPRIRSGTPPTVAATAMRRTGSTDRPSAYEQQQQQQQQQQQHHQPPRAVAPSIAPVMVANNHQRPPVVSHATAPGRQELVDQHTAAAAIMERQRSRNTYSAGSPLADQDARDERERAAQEVAFERDYVVVEKRAVEVNAFADELAHSPRIQGGFPRSGAHPAGGVIPRRATTQGLLTTTTAPTAPTTAHGSSSPHQSLATAKAMQVIPGRSRADSAHHRQSSYERRYGQSPTSATSAISKALHMASGRLFGVGFSPPLAINKGGRSPPMGYNAFPAYPTTQGSLLIVGDGAKTNVALDEDAKTVQIIEECATRSDVVYGFAEVKYRQLIPLAPSVTETEKRGPGQQQQQQQQHSGGEDSADSGLTVDAIVTLSEEALVLYVKALSLLAKCMDIAGIWWARKNRADAFGDANASAIASNRINNIVQWVRNRFNEVLEKAEFVRLKLVEAQKRLPRSHPSHPNNHHFLGAAAGPAGSIDVVVSSGVTAEKLMYDRALEMSRAAAINELTGEDLAGCEIAYVTAIRMLEGVLEDDELPRSGSFKDTDRLALDGVPVEDRKVVVKLVSSMRGRLASLRKKLALIAKQVPAPVGAMGKISNLAPATQTIEAAVQE